MPAQRPHEVGAGRACEARRASLKPQYFSSIHSKTAPNYAIIKMLSFFESEVSRSAHPAQLLSGGLPFAGRAAGRLPGRHGLRQASPAYSISAVQPAPPKDGLAETMLAFATERGIAAARHAGGGGARQFRAAWLSAVQTAGHPCILMSCRVACPRHGASICRTWRAHHCS